ncbi:MAG TPA: ATP-binding protein [Candidatus Acidoferrum sp.]|nr:ATP-binding protein [Candidatus Acidoferrum sp.]
MARFRSLRWRLTFLYVGLLAVLLALGGVAQYFAAREVLFRTNADVLASEYNAVFTAFRKGLTARAPSSSASPTLPKTANPPARLLLVSQQFANELRSRHTSAAIFALNGGLVAWAPSMLQTNEDMPTLRTLDYRQAGLGHVKPYYLATGSDGSTTYLVSLSLIRNGGAALGIAQLSIPTDDIDRTLGLDARVAIAGSLLLLLLALLLSPLIVGRALRPLEHMSKTAGALAAGDYKQRVTIPPTGDEIGKLALAFNQMAAGVDQAFEVRRQSEEQMRQFLADASHELRTPLTSIAGYIDVLSRRDSVDPQTLQTALTAMQRESSRMTRLVNDLLTLTRFESARAPRRERLTLDRFVGQTLDELSLHDRGAAESRQLQPGIVIEADPDALKQVVGNFAQNALKYAPGAEQRWSVFKLDGRAAIRLEDTGPGIARQDLPHIFERFYRGQQARDSSTGGSGLGLAIAKSIVEAHHGEIEAESEPGKGATFTAWLPLAA